MSRGRYSESYSDEELLEFDPFAGDKGGGGVSYATEKVVKTRKEAECNFDGTPHIIKVGSRAVRYSAVLEGEGWKHFLLCADCISQDLLKYE